MLMSFVLLGFLQMINVNLHQCTVNLWSANPSKDLGEWVLSEITRITGH